jgi:hypothetical protein
MPGIRPLARLRCVENDVGISEQADQGAAHDLRVRVARALLPFGAGEECPAEGRGPALQGEIVCGYEA